MKLTDRTMYRRHLYVFVLMTAENESGIQRDLKYGSTQEQEEHSRSNFDPAADIDRTGLRRL